MATRDTNEPFRQGVLLYRQGKYLESLSKFDEAIIINDQDKTLYDTRAAALEKLGRYKEALRDSKKVVDLDPKWWQGYARSARLFLEVRKPSSALRMADLALERVRISDVERRSELVRLKERALNEAQLALAAASTRQGCTCLELPVEIIYEVICMTVGDKEARIFPLMLVCRRFRDIILNVPMLWQRLTIGPKTAQKKAETWINRARGSLSGLRILSGFDFDKLSSYLRTASEDFWFRLEDLEISLLVGNRELYRRLPKIAVEQMRLRSLKLSWFSGIRNVGDPLISFDLSRLSTFVCETDSVDAWKSIWSCTSLTTLHLKSSKLSHDSLYHLIAQNLNLETLILLTSFSFLGNIPDGFNERNIIMLSHLYRLEFDLIDATNYYLHFLRFPNLESLQLDYRSLSNPSFVDELLAQPLVHLSELYFFRCQSAASSLIALLRALPKLERFSYILCMETHVLNELLIALAETNREEGGVLGKNVQKQARYCPRLKFLNFTDSLDLLARPLVQFIKSRLPTHIAPNDRSPCSEEDHPSSTPMCGNAEMVESPLPIKTLILNNCPKIDTEILPWLRLRVERVEFTMTQQNRVTSSRRLLLL